jgi:hypothetical protein
MEEHRRQNTGPTSSFGLAKTTATILCFRDRTRSELDVTMKFLGLSYLAPASIFSAQLIEAIQLDVSSPGTSKQFSSLMSVLTQQTCRFNQKRCKYCSIWNDEVLYWQQYRWHAGNLPAPYYWWEAGAMFGSMIDYWYPSIQSLSPPPYKTKTSMRQVLHRRHHVQRRSPASAYIASRDTEQLYANELDHDGGKRRPGFLGNGSHDSSRDKFPGSAFE